MGDGIFGGRGRWGWWVSFFMVEKLTNSRATSIALVHKHRLRMLTRLHQKYGRCIVSAVTANRPRFVAFHSRQIRKTCATAGLTCSKHVPVAPRTSDTYRSTQKHTKHT